MSFAARPLMNAARVAISNQTISANAATPTQAVAGYRLNTNGNAEQSVNSAFSTLEQWLSGAAASAYDARATVTGGAGSGGTFGCSWTTFTQITSSLLMQLTSDGFGTGACTRTVTVEIRPTGGGANVASATIILNASDLP